MKKDKWKNMSRQKLHKKKAKRNFDQRLSENMNYDDFLLGGKK
ncbi:MULTISPECIES: hypothetical protein [Spiroplasma]|uniref:Uncharacterized protein n=1 Tax=Spiroplasma ixodetis TaxID=2141 RepID=A0ABM8BT09_9MOLU|nr:hypothetical protein [Spiroplasma ixodetis]BDT02997.1 hypothetical protein SHM_06430 [Spiroplasma ixodetis]